MTMPFACEGTLFDLVKGGGPLGSAVKWTTLLRQLSSGLQHMHAVLNIAHLDVSLENILVFAGGGRYVLCDFGLVQPLSSPPPVPPVGKKQYMARHSSGQLPSRRYNLSLVPLPSRPNAKLAMRVCVLGAVVLSLTHTLAPSLFFFGLLQSGFAGFL